MSDKQTAMNNVHFDQSGFGSKKITYRYAKQIDSSVNMSDIDAFLRNTLNKETTQMILFLCCSWGVLRISNLFTVFKWFGNSTIWSWYGLYWYA